MKIQFKLLAALLGAILMTDARAADPVPADPLIATVYGTPVRLSAVRFGNIASFEERDADKAVLFYRQGVEATIIQPVLDRYASMARIDAAPGQISSLRKRLASLAAKTTSAPPPDNAYWDSTARSEARNWEIKAALYRQYGGEVSYRIEGLYPGDAVAKLIASEIANGNIRIYNRNDKYLLSHLNAGNYRVAKTTADYFFEKPWWSRTAVDLKAHGFIFQPAGFGFMCASALDQSTLEILAKGPGQRRN